MASKRTGSILMVGGLLLITAALFLTCRNVREAQQAAAAAEDTARQIESLRVEPPPVPDTVQEPEEVPDYLRNPDMEMPVLEIDGHDYIGTLEIPALDLSLPVMSQWSYPNLKLSPCRFSGSAYLDDLIIAGHNYTRHFGGLKHLSIGDEVLFTDADGHVFSYAVSELEQLGPNDVEELESGSWALTLFTCTLGGKFRVTVRCERA